MTTGNHTATFRAFTYLAKRCADRIITPVEIFPPFDPKSGEAPAGFKAEALWDTGADKSTILPEIASQLGLVATSFGSSNTAGGIITHPMHRVNIGLPNRILIRDVKVREHPNLIGFQAILGMDVISCGDFSITNADGRTMMSFRCPSVAHLDYVAEGNQKAMAGVGKNSPCPCGKKKADGSPVKYKRCCGAMG